jgi:RNA polymerase sigma-70 factor (ECF subfamily)
MKENDNSIEHLLAQARLPAAKARAGRARTSKAGMERLAVAVRERLYPFILRTTWDHDLTEDILQETLLTMVRELGSLREAARFWPWVHQIAWSKIQDNVRSARVHSAAKATLLARQPSEGHSGGNVLDTSIQAETRERLRALLERLSQPHRDIIHLRCFEQLPYAKIASLTRMSPQKARARFHRATEALKAQML